MKRIITDSFFIIALLLGDSTRLLAQGLSVSRFLEGVSSHFVGDEVEQNQSSKLYETLNAASPAEVEKALPILLQYAHVGNEAHARGYAVLFLTAIAIRPDGADLLSSKVEEISSLLLDLNPGIQKVAVAITDYVIAKPATKPQPYLSAMETAIQKSQTPQDADAGMIGPLLTFGGNDLGASKSVQAFLQRDDLTPATRSELVHELGVKPGLPEEVSRYLVGRLDDPDPHVRAAALVAYADSTTAYHSMGKDRVQRIANAPQEIPGIRELAKAAMAGKTNLSPNYDLPPIALDPATGAPAEKPKDH